MRRSIYNLLLPFLLLAFLANLSSCAFRRVASSKDIAYSQGNPARNIAPQKLDVYAPKTLKGTKDVLVFIHGGNWNSGRKELYSFLGNRMARKEIVTVVIQYPLSPQATYHDMATSTAAALAWVSQNIAAYGGDPQRIFVSGHSAGGHLAALVALRKAYFDSLQIPNPIKGVVLIDAAGLNMQDYLQEKKYAKGHTYLNTFTTDPAQWKEATPLHHLHGNMPPLLIFRGEKTYPSIEKSTEEFVMALKRFVPAPNYHVLEGKKHIPMITQFFWTWNPIYDQITHFMDSVK